MDDTGHAMVRGRCSALARRGVCAKPSFCTPGAAIIRRVSGDRTCAYCGAPLGARDRVCYRCQRAASGAAVPPFPGDGARAGRLARAAGVRERGTLPPAGPRPAGASPAEDGPGRRPGPDQPIQFEVIWGRDRRTYTMPASGATIGSTAESDIVIPATFLSPLHAYVSWRGDAWQVDSLSAGGSVLLRGKAVRSGSVAPGDVFRLADGVGNFVTVNMPRTGRARPREGALRGPLPGRDESYLIGTDASCRIRLDHPLVQPRHVAVRRDRAGTLWMQDRGTAAGTYVNGQRLRGNGRLAVGDIIQLGPFSARVGPHALEPLEQVAGVDISVRDARVDAPAARQGRPRTLLNNVSLRLQPASMTAVAGPSGAGKTTLMRALSGQLPAARGTVEYNGVDLGRCRQAFAALMGYVPQDDVVHADLTVTEALGYQARLRLGRGSSADMREARVADVLGLMGLTAQRAQLVKTLSGGQRKRVSIACELLSEPQVIFLDEPTSGLDPGLDKRMMLLLRLLADQGRTVVLTTHAIAHVDVCDTLVLVGPGGHVIYAGAPEEALDWFGVESLGDVFSLVDSVEAAARAADRVRQRQRAHPDAQTPASHPLAGGALTAPAALPRPTAAARPGPPARGAVASLGGARPPIGSPAWRSALADQGKIFAGRYVRLLGRDRTALAFSLLQGVAVAVLTALVAPKPFSWTLQGNAPTFVFGCAAVWFGMIGAVRELVKERTIWRREYLAGGNLPAYLASKVLVLGALAAVQSLTLTVVLALTLGLPASSPVGGPFAGVFISLWLANLCGMSVGLLVSVTSSSADRAMSLVPYLLITQLVLCGVLFKLGAMTFTSWIMPARWAVSALGGIAGLSAARLHQSSGLYPHSALGLLSDWLMLVILAAVGIALTAWSLQRQGDSWGVGAEPSGRPGFPALLARRTAAARPSLGDRGA
jgi:ABC transport system ATP-binding/permease protein